VLAGSVERRGPGRQLLQTLATPGELALTLTRDWMALALPRLYLFPTCIILPLVERCSQSPALLFEAHHAR